MGSKNQFRNNEDWEVYKSNERNRLRERMKAVYDESKLTASCYRCGAECLINFKTNKPFTACIDCRAKENERARNRNNVRNLEATE